MPDPLVEALEAARAAGDTDRCLTLLAQLSDRDPALGRWPYLQGILLQDRGDVEGAVAAYRRAVEVEPTHAFAWVNLGRLLDDRLAWDEALACYDRAIALPAGEQDAVAWSNRGNTLLSLDRFEEALACYERALALEPDGEALRGRQTALGWLGRVEEANAARPQGTPWDRGELRQHTRPVGARRLVVRYWTGRHTRPDQLDELAQGMLDRVATLADTPPGLDDRVTIQWGWSPLVLRARGHDLVLCEPDYAEAPFDAHVWDVGFTLQTTLMHFLTSEITSTEACGCSATDVVAYVPGVLERPSVVLRRFHATDEDGFSGWIVGPDDPDAFAAAVEAGDLDGMRSGDLARVRTPLLKVLVLPPGFTVRFEAHAVVSVLDPDGVERFAAG